MDRPTFAAAINCMDGRTIIPATEWTRQHLKVDYVDLITEPGMIGAFAARDERLLHSVKRMLHISLRAHGTRTVVLVAHYNCVGNPVAKEKQLQQISHSIQILRSWEFPEIERIIGIWLNEQFQAELIEDHRLKETQDS